MCRKFSRSILIKLLKNSPQYVTGDLFINNFLTMLNMIREVKRPSKGVLGSRCSKNFRHFPGKEHSFCKVVGYRPSVLQKLLFIVDDFLPIFQKL